MKLMDSEFRLSDIGLVIAAKRDEAVGYRSSSGIEQLWLQCAEAYWP